MNHLAEILKVIEGGVARNPGKVASYAELLATKLRKGGDEASARRVLRALNAATVTLHPADLQTRVVPVDSDSRVSIAEVSYPSSDNIDLVLPAPARAAIDDFILAYERLTELLAAGIRSPGHLLLYGPPGCGKTQTAAFVAAALDLPLVTARLDGLISSYLGNTAKNMRALFEYVDRVPCVLLLDEFDAVAKMRDDPNELGELKRAVNSLLQNIDLLPPGTAVIAATNHPQLLDPAVWRRFEIHVEITPPDHHARRYLFHLYGGDVSEELTEVLALLTEGRSAADVRRACEFILREQVLHPALADSYGANVQALLRYLSRTRGSGESSPGTTLDEHIVYLRANSPEVFSYSVIGKLLGVSKGKVGKVLKTDEGGGSDG